MNWNLAKQIAKEAAITAAAAGIWTTAMAARGVVASIKHAPAVGRAVSKGAAEAIRAGRRGCWYMKNYAIPNAKNEINQIRYTLHEMGQKYPCPECGRTMTFDGTYHRCRCGFYFRNIA
ncbi:hypothetical protein MTAT_20180 [Moorella thermoacetica]|uniref:Uncharacterized protein n=1 Tax=Neomoorella thermoacetica TaxID=1525 RepID=A0AAC9MUE3_NEOTH|nr:hypothetical protein [Moorella thermoacetica]AOQ24673.1 hypothetical protein Maut_02245 [Moorella thermoacetica]TYL12776.1 hypothetical protein MTAT_20180 [Moorella thermoacetica]